MESGREIIHLVLSSRGNPVIVMLSKGAAFLRVNVGALIPAIVLVRNLHWFWMPRSMNINLGPLCTSNPT